MSAPNRIELVQTRNFTYDNVNRLTGMTNGTSNESYTFDGVGNRTASHLSATYGYQAYNRMTSTASATMTYNANANLTQKIEGGTTWTYAWDYENRMTSSANGTATAEYSYDALGRRIRRVVAAMGEVTKFTYDGLDVVMDDDATSGVTKYQNCLVVDDKLKLTNGGVSKYFIADHLGSTVALTDASVRHSIRHTVLALQTTILKFGATFMLKDSLIPFIAFFSGIVACILSWLLMTDTSSPLREYLLYHPALRNLWGDLNFPVLAFMSITGLPNVDTVFYFLIFAQWFLIVWTVLVAVRWISKRTQKA